MICSTRSTDCPWSLVSTITHKHIDMIALLTEMGFYWKQIHNNDQWHNQVRESFALNMISTSIQQEWTHDDGRCSIRWSVLNGSDEIIHHIIKQGIDTTGLGWWSLCPLEERENHHLQAILCHHIIDGGKHGLVNAQHLWQETSCHNHDIVEKIKTLCNIQEWISLDIYLPR